MIKGWFIGNFEPNSIKTELFEVGVKKYNSQDFECSHFHKIATEITVIISGFVKMNGKQYSGGDIIIIEPGESTDFLAETDVVTVVVKIPSVKNDKYENNIS